MAMFKTRTVVRHLVLSTVMLALNFPFRSIAALPGLTSSQRNASSPDIHQNAFPGDHPRTQESQWLSNAYDRVNEQLQNATSVRQSRNGCLSNSNEGHLSNPNEGRPYIRCVWKVLKKAERKIVKADDILQRVLEKFQTTNHGRTLTHEQRDTAQTNYIDHQGRLGEGSIHAKIVLLVNQLVHARRQFKRSSQFLKCPLHLGRLLDKASHFFRRAVRHLKAWHSTKRRNTYALEIVDNAFTECAQLAEYMKDVTYRSQWIIGEIKLELIGHR